MKGFKPEVKPTLTTGTTRTNVEDRVTTYGCHLNPQWFTFRPCSQEMLSHIGEYLTTACNASKFMLIGCKCKWESLFWKNHHTTKYSERCTSLYGCRLSQFSVPQIPFIWISDYLLYMKAIEHHLFCDNETKVARILIKTICTVVGYVKNGWGYGK